MNGPKDVSSFVQIVDGRRWDGTDFFGGGDGLQTVTRRAVDWLLSIHAYPFEAQPVPVNIAGMTKAERERLEQARTPLRNDAKPCSP